MTVTPTLVTVREGHRLAVRRPRADGVPLLLLHGFPCTSLIWSHTIEPLAEAGFDVAAPDLRGYGDSDFAPDDFYDFAAFNTDLIGLFDALGWDRVVVAGHDLGAMVAVDLANRHPDRIDRLVILDDSMPDLPDAFAAAGIPPGTPKPALYDYQDRQGRHADELVAELNTPERRRRYIAEFFGHRMWCPPNAFGEADLALLTEPYADADRLRASFADYEVVMGTRPLSAPELIDRPVQQQTLVLIGRDQVTLGENIEARCAIAYPQAVGPFWVSGAGHFMPWEKPAVVHRAIRSFCGDLLAG
ncbi:MULTISPECIES: alpha/beta fold hydrolase [Actinoalloteichus]|uniref:Hydrolase or acyltransferase of alpha/beta superfamily n=1 Tax=Actinoalloteichus fjordicus TaxID=1612552 RepID=A0AAC9LGS8_9PSEU|nr:MULTISPECIES: alpha/beta hydrolase [Actinoalloteichus]APU16487.1 putative hydrolase or acyltransferase of alpha/beta superfamily [Actinoalloteichus fjordicus]APU22546.1 putative hydrolase or acyltransferase of alpha/beta superfamily [Actinoalloteichus sp. GBA129-24]